MDTDTPIRKPEPVATGTRCVAVTDGRVCGHVYVAHGNGGTLCCMCPCKRFSDVPVVTGEVLQ